MRNNTEPKKWSDVKATDVLEYLPKPMAPLIVPISKNVTVRYAFVEQTREGVKIVASFNDIQELIEKVVSKFKRVEGE